jgi:hypothetical protein
MALLTLCQATLLVIFIDVSMTNPAQASTNGFPPAPHGRAKIKSRRSDTHLPLGSQRLHREILQLDGHFSRLSALMRHADQTQTCSFSNVVPHLCEAVRWTEILDGDNMMTNQMRDSQSALSLLLRLCRYFATTDPSPCPQRHSRLVDAGRSQRPRSNVIDPNGLVTASHRATHPGARRGAWRRAEPCGGTAKRVLADRRSRRAPHVERLRSAARFVPAARIPWRIGHGPGTFGMWR